MSEYAALEIIGPAATLDLEPDLVELLMLVLDDAIDDAARDLRVEDPPDVAISWADDVTGLRDALHSVALEPGPET